MIKSYQKIFIIVILLFLTLPMGYFLGFKENTHLYGHESKTDLPSIQELSFQNNSFQNQFQKWWQSHFLYRKLALKIKNQLYDYMNLGCFHSGNSVIQGKDGFLFGNGPFPNAFSNNINKVMLENSLKQLEEISQVKKIPIYFVLAPHKASLFLEKWPLLYTFFYRDRTDNYTIIEEIIEENGFKVYNAKVLGEELKKNGSFQPFTESGYHWNYGFSNLTLKNSINYFELGEIQVKELEFLDKPISTERDLASLLNLLIPYTVKSEKYPFFSLEIKNLQENITVIGNSFSNEYVHSLRQNGFKFSHYGNPPFTQKIARDILSQSKAIIFVYTNVEFITPMQFVAKTQILYDNLYPKYSLNEENSEINLIGFSHRENWGRWTNGKKASLTSNLDSHIKGITFALAHVLGDQDVTVFANGAEVFKQNGIKPN